jgi:hypothetical protein
MAWLQNRYDVEHAENAALRADNWRLISENAALIRAAQPNRHHKRIGGRESGRGVSSLKGIGRTYIEVDNAKAPKRT